MENSHNSGERLEKSFNSIYVEIHKDKMMNYKYVLLDGLRAVTSPRCPIGIIEVNTFNSSSQSGNAARHINSFVYFFEEVFIFHGLLSLQS